MQCTPFSLISEFGQKLFSLSSDSPGLQTLVVSKLLCTKFPNDLACSVATCPLTIDVGVDIDVEAALDMHCHVGSGD